MSTTEQPLRDQMVEQMITDGTLHSPAWIDAFRSIPRHVFLPRFFRQSSDRSGWEAIDRDDPGALDLVYTGATWVTQLDNDPHRWDTARRDHKPVPGVPTSSSTAPGLMALMLEALNCHDGHRVLEIGTGTGYNTALLCHRLGDHKITTVEVDPAVAAAAAANLHTCGFAPVVVVADGSAGHPATAPYDRLIATCSTPTIPPAWITQTTPGGLILTSLHRDLGGGALILLHVHDNQQAQGRFLPHYGGFMPVRTHPPADAAARLHTALTTTAADHPTRELAIPHEMLDHPDFGMLTALRLPDVASIGFIPDTGPQRWLLDNTGNWARIDEDQHTVTQHGPRRLWDEIETLHQQWTQLGKPTRDRIGLTATTTGHHHYWLDHPQPRSGPGRQPAPQTPGSDERDRSQPRCAEG